MKNSNRLSADELRMFSEALKAAEQAQKTLDFVCASIASRHQLQEGETFSPDGAIQRRALPSVE